MKNSDKPQITISMRQFFDEDSGQHGVQVIVSGLASEAEAERAMAFMQEKLCGGEIGIN